MLHFTDRLTLKVLATSVNFIYQEKPNISNFTIQKSNYVSIQTTPERLVNVCR